MNCEFFIQPQTKHAFLSQPNYSNYDYDESKKIATRKLYRFKFVANYRNALLNELCCSSAAAIGNIDKQYACLFANREKKKLEKNRKNCKYFQLFSA